MFDIVIEFIMYITHLHNRERRVKREEKRNEAATPGPGPSQGSAQANTGPIKRKLTVEPSLVD